MKATDYLTREEIKELVEASDLEGWKSVATTWSIIAGTMALVAWYPSVLTVLVALVLIGGRHLALAILMHDASHRSLFKTRWLNDVVGKWLCAAPVWQDLERYRVHHMKHHNHTNSEEDPDLCLSDPFPVPGESLRRKFLRDLSGITALKRYYGTALMDLGYITYTASANAQPIDQTGRSTLDVIRTGVKYLGPVVVTNATLFGILWALGNPWLYLLWIGGNMTFFSLFVRIRSIAEHACTAKVDNPFQNTRTTMANIFARLTVAPHYVNYHMEHHLLVTVPPHKFKKMHRLLEERGALKDSPVAKGYLDVLKEATLSPEKVAA